MYDILRAVASQYGPSLRRETCVLRDARAWEALFMERRAFWDWNEGGDPACPHVELPRGGCSNGYFNSRRVLESPKLVADACADIISANAALFQNKGDIREVVVAAGFAANTVAHEIAKQLDIECAFAEPYVTDGGKRVTLRRSSRMGPHTRLYIVGDGTITGHTLERTIIEASKSGVEVASPVCVLVNASGERQVRGKEIFALIERPVRRWRFSRDCSLCKGGSEAISRPKDRWEELTTNP